MRCRACTASCYQTAATASVAGERYSLVCFCAICIIFELCAKTVAVRNQLRELQHPIEATSTLRGDNQSSLLVATTLRLHRGEAEGVSLFGRAVATVPLAG